MLGAAEIQVLTKNLEQRLVRRERDLRRFAVDVQRDLNVLRLRHEHSSRSEQAGDGVVGDERAIGSEPLGPSGRNHCAVQFSAPRKARVAIVASVCAQLAALDAGGDERAHRPFVAIAFGDDPRPHGGGQGIHFEVSGRAFDFLDDAPHMGGGERVQACRRAAPRRSAPSSTATSSRSSVRSWQKKRISFLPRSSGRGSRARCRLRRRCRACRPRRTRGA